MPEHEIENPWGFACKWYRAEVIEAAIRDNAEIPLDVKSREFAVWMTRQYCLAMAKGIELGWENPMAAKSPAPIAGQGHDGGITPMIG